MDSRSVLEDAQPRVKMSFPRYIQSGHAHIIQTSTGQLLQYSYSFLSLPG